MKKWLLVLTLLTSWGYAQNSNSPYDITQREFNSAIEQIFQEFTEAQSALGNEVIVTFYNAEGEAQSSNQSSNAPDFLKTLSDYKMNFMLNNNLSSTKGISLIQEVNLNP